MKSFTIRKGRIIALTILYIICGAMAGLAQDLWLMKGHDARRTGQSKTNGPKAIDLSKSWVAEAPAAFVINIGATVTKAGVYFASWGLLRKDALGRDERFWDKSDGKLYGHRLADGQSLWGGSLKLDLTARCYEYPGRTKTSQDNFWCGGANDYHVTFYNGTIEGQAAVDTGRNALYIGRGDGKLYAVDPVTGRSLWRFRSYNPKLLNDPDGGGEVISSPFIGPDGTVYFGTWGVGPYETNAFYAVNPDSTLQWRFPADSSLTARTIFASPALSPDQSTIYCSTFIAEGGGALPAKLYALNLKPFGAVPDHARLKWELELRNVFFPVYTTTMAVGSDGVIYVGGYYPLLLGAIPLIFAIEEVQTPQGMQPRLKWAKPYVELREGAQVGQFVGGIALREEGGQTKRLYVTTSILRGVTTNHLEEGKLYAVDPATGQVLASYDPSNDVPAAVGSLNSPAVGADGIIYFGVRGKFAQGGNPSVNGHVFAVEYDASAAQFHKVWNYEVDGQIDWNHPAIGPDGGIYIGSSIGGEFDATKTYEPGEIPPNTTCKFYALKPLITSVNDRKTAPIGFAVEPNYPNPFNPSTTIRFSLPVPAQVHLIIYNVYGQLVRTLRDQRFGTGYHQVVWDGRDDAGKPVASGVYFLQMRALRESGNAEFVQVKKMLRVE